MNARMNPPNELNSFARRKHDTANQSGHYGMSIKCLRNQRCKCHHGAQNMLSDQSLTDGFLWDYLWFYSGMSGDTTHTLLPSARNQPVSAITLILTMETLKKEEGGLERQEDDDRKQRVREINEGLKSQLHEMQTNVRVWTSWASTPRYKFWRSEW